MQMQKPALPATVKVKVLRAFTTHERKIAKVNDEIELPRTFALEMKAANKAAIIAEPEPVPAKEEKSASDKAAGRKEK